MNIALKRFYYAATSAALFGALAATATTESTATDIKAPAAASPAAATADTGTSSSPSAEMSKLFGDPVVAKGKGVEVRRSQLDAEVQRLQTTLASRGRSVSPEEVSSLEPQVLNDLISKQLLLDQATAADRAQGKADFEKIEQRLKAAGKLTDAEFDQKLKTQLQLLNITRAQWEKQSTDQTTALAVLKRELNVTATDAQAKEYYRTNAQAFEVPEQVRLRHILLLTIDPTTQKPLSDDQQQAKHKQIENILKRARAGGDFAQLAKQYSEDRHTKDEGGELPPLSEKQLDAAFGLAFGSAAFSLTNHQISDVITTRFGYDIMQLQDKTPAHKLALTDKLPSSDTTVIEAVKNTLEQQKLAELAPAYLKKLNKEADVKILDPTLKAAVADDAGVTNAPLAVPGK